MKKDNCPDAVIVHQLPTRLRLKVPAKSGQLCYFEQAEKTLQQYAQIKKVRCNPRTASILLDFNSPLNEALFFSFTEKNQLLVQQQHVEKSRNKPLLTQVRAELSKADLLFKLKSSDNIDFDSAYFVSLVLFGFYQLSRGQVLGPASTLFSQAVHVIRATDKIP